MLNPSRSVPDRRRERAGDYAVAPVGILQEARRESLRALEWTMCLFLVGFAMFPAAPQPWVWLLLIVFDDDVPVLAVCVSQELVQREAPGVQKWMKFHLFAHEHHEEFAERGAERCYLIAEKH